MRRAVFGGICWAVLTCGCSNYMPITEEDFVSMSARSINLPVIVRDGVPFRGLLLGCIGPSDANLGITFYCDRRAVPEDYDPDMFVVDIEDDEFDSVDLPCVPLDLPGEHSTDCATRVLDADPGRPIRFTVNEYTDSTVTMPLVPALTSPEPGSKISVSGDDLALSWKPISTGDPMTWRVSLDYSEEGDPCYELGFMTSDGLGDLEDSGSFVVPKAELPTGLPEEGCPATVTVKTVHEGTMDPEIKKGRIVGESYFGVKITLVP